jgi:hypothetical protein
MAEKLFKPAIKNGLLLHLPVAIFLFAGSLTLFLLAFQEQYGTFFILFFVVALLLLIPFVFIAYRTFALLRGGYQLNRDGLRLHWGLRSEAIPMPDIEWIKPVSQITFELPLPRLSFPGAILGVTQTRDQGPVEFMASEIEHLVLVATHQKIYAISPARESEFLREFQSITELGSLAPIQPSTTLPANFLRNVWSDQLARWLIFIGLVCTLALLTLASLTIPGRQTVTLGFDPAGNPLPAVPAIRLLMLPALCIFLFLIDLVSGLYFYRNPKQRSASYLLWSASIITPLLLFVPLLIIK